MAKQRVEITLPNGDKKWFRADNMSDLVSKVIQQYGSLYDIADQIPYQNNGIPLIKNYAHDRYENEFVLKVGGHHAQNTMYALKKRIYPNLGDYHLDEINLKIANQFFFGLKDESKTNVKTVLNALRQIFDAAMDDEYVDENIFRSPRLVVKYRAPRTRDAIEVDIVKEAIKNSETRPWKDQATILIPLYTGLRMGELFALKWEDVDLEHDIIHVRHTLSVDRDGNTIEKDPKSTAGIRDIPIVPNLKQFLLLAPSHNVYVLETRNKTQYQYGSAQHFCDSLFAKVGLGDYSMHQLRHTFATQMLPLTDPKTLQYIMGHSDIDITLNTYSHKNNEQVDKLRVLGNNLYS